MKRLLAVLVVAGCSTSPTGSGVAETKLLAGLSADDVGKLCDFRVSLEGGARSVMCSDGSSVVLPTKVACSSEVMSLGVECTAHVSDAERCFEAIGKDACAASGGGDCTAYLTCVVISH